ncbi:probable folate-biopterin transporter 8, chloroplastic isoform X1 [Malus sylvestris]|uniref:probable folate-biopterin transporter 8, chloroplastic isoform X1 n=1 Tax=Malus sylvestris TaxID=3752 RepID=UPI0021ABE3A2|nr:probable folate-biopterin transporter 8, chloroplastic isoform X1 [Malus sylvestris]
MDIITVNHRKTPTIKATSFPPKPHPLFSPPKPAGPIQTKTQIRNPILPNPATQVIYRKSRRSSNHEERSGFRFPQLGGQEMLFLCGFGYWMQGFRCFPWLALNFHMAHNLQMHPSTLLLVQRSANLPMVAKPLYALYISGAHRVPYISIGGLVLSVHALPRAKMGVYVISRAQSGVYAARTLGS